MRIERIYQNLRREICLLDLPPGLVLREQDLADRFNVSRTPIRNVLGRLTADGLVESRQGVGTTVTTLDTRDVLDIYFVRATLSEAIGDSQPHPPASDTLHALEELSRRCDTLRGEAAVRRYGEINLELHSHIFSIVGNRPLREISDRLFYQTARIWFQGAASHRLAVGGGRDQARDRRGSPGDDPPRPQGCRARSPQLHRRRHAGHPAGARRRDGRFGAAGIVRDRRPSGTGTEAVAVSQVRPHGGFGQLHGLALVTDHHGRRGSGGRTDRHAARSDEHRGHQRRGDGGETRLSHHEFLLLQVGPAGTTCHRAGVRVEHSG
ncbi:MAG: GntR family transcriptional regulator [Gammaproteobacteria bacterium]|nr:GntR family transcriptional regulator [Gammaproteobacteria bacterium]